MMDITTAAVYEHEMAKETDFRSARCGATGGRLICLCIAILFLRRFP
ncbi:MAG: hypothetical protein LBG87_00010 [Spirochaetaceae bacterium]|nr:hypothetical protein [Spirochaetaceae bacterium]